MIGAGFTGLSTALHLAKSGASVVILEAQRVGWGASGRNGGQLYGGQRRDVDWLEARLGTVEARRLWDLGEAAKSLVKQLISELAIECDLTPGVAMVAHKSRYVAEYHALADKLATRYGRQGLRENRQRGNSRAAGYRRLFRRLHRLGRRSPASVEPGVRCRTRCIELGVRIYENTRATEFIDGDSVIVRSAAGSVTADHLVLAANGHLGNLAPKLAGRMMPINNFVIATEPLDERLANEINPRRIAVADSRFVINYFRMTRDRRLLFGGGENYRTGFPRDIAAFVRPYLLKIYPQLAHAAIDYAWGGTLAITLNRMPHFGHLSTHVHFAHGYSGQGVALAHLAGQLFAEMIRGDSSRFDAFGVLPTRPFPGGRWLRWPGMVAGMLYFALRDRI